MIALDDRGRVAARETLALDAATRASAVARLGLWLGSLQPSLAALPPGETGAELGARVEEAKRGYGGALETFARATPAGDPEREALDRARSLQRERAVRPAWLPGPIEALAALLAMVRSGEMLRHVVASLFRVATGFAIAVLLGIPFGVMLGRFAAVSAISNAVIQSLRPISPIAWLPVATLALGGGDVAAIFLIFLAAFFPIAVSTAAAVAGVDLKVRALGCELRRPRRRPRAPRPAAGGAAVDLTSLRIALGPRGWSVSRRGDARRGVGARLPGARRAQPAPLRQGGRAR